MEIKIRKINIFLEETKEEMGQPIESNVIATIAVTANNPYSGLYSKDLSKLSDWAAEIAPSLLEKLLIAANLTKETVLSFGKASIIGINGELEHAAALIHPTLGTPVRNFLNGSVVMPSTIKVGVAGTTIDVPFRNKSVPSLASASSIEIRIPDAPKSDEFVMLLTVSSSNRPLARNYDNAVDLTKLK